MCFRGHDLDQQPGSLAQLGLRGSAVPGVFGGVFGSDPKSGEAFGFWLVRVSRKPGCFCPVWFFGLVAAFVSGFGWFLVRVFLGPSRFFFGGVSLLFAVLSCALASSL